MAEARRDYSLLIIGYGSFMSGHGLLREPTVELPKIVSAFPIALRNCRRGLGKPARAGHLAMDLEPVGPGQGITGRRLATPPLGFQSDEIGALALEFENSTHSVDWLERRDGYGGRLGSALENSRKSQESGTIQESLGGFLLRRARECNFRVREYCRMVFGSEQLEGYVPWPVEVLGDTSVPLVGIVALGGGGGVRGTNDQL